MRSMVGGLAARAALVDSPLHQPAAGPPPLQMQGRSYRIVRNVTEYLSASTGGMLCSQTSRASPRSR